MLLLFLTLVCQRRGRECGGGGRGAPRRLRPFCVVVVVVLCTLFVSPSYPCLPYLHRITVFHLGFIYRHNATSADAPPANAPNNNNNNNNNNTDNVDDADLIPIVGLCVSQSPRGWLRRIWQVLDEDQLRLLLSHPTAAVKRQAQRHFLLHHAIQVGTDRLRGATEEAGLY